MNRSEIIAAARQCLSRELQMKEKLFVKQLMFAVVDGAVPSDRQIAWLKAIRESVLRPAPRAGEGAPVSEMDGAAATPAAGGETHQGGASGAPEADADRQEE